MSSSLHQLMFLLGTETTDTTSTLPPPPPPLQKPTDVCRFEKVAVSSSLADTNIKAHFELEPKRIINLSRLEHMFIYLITSSDTTVIHCERWKSYASEYIKLSYRSFKDGDGDGDNQFQSMSS
ncbi:hypothetical protein Tco_1176142 [Tanacetum coccineum]